MTSGAGPLQSQLEVAHAQKELTKDRFRFVVDARCIDQLPAWTFPVGY